MDAPERTIERDEVVVDTGLTYTEREPVLVRMRRRGRRIELRDDGRALELAGRPAGSRERATRVVDAYDLNITRTRVVFVPGVEGRADREWLAGRVAETSFALYDALLELE
jgi:hypothetical protein